MNVKKLKSWIQKSVWKENAICVPTKILNANMKDALSTDRVIAKLYGSKLILSMLEQLDDPLFVEYHRPFTSALADLLLYSLNGCIDASLQDIREGLGPSLQPHEVSTSHENTKFMKMLNLSTDPNAKKEIEWINERMKNKQSWLYKLRDNRNKSAHRDPIGWMFQRTIGSNEDVSMPGLVDSDKDFHSYFKETFQLVKGHCLEVRKRYGKYQPYPFLDF